MNGSRVQAQDFEDQLSAALAQSSFKCARCQGDLKVHQIDGRWAVRCVRNPHHRTIREVTG